MHRRLWYLLGIYALLIVYVETFFVRGLRPPLWITPLTTLVGFVLTLLHAMQRLGRRPALTLLATTALVSFLFEALGVATGWVYGPYHYTDRLGPRLLGVPFLIPLAWFLMAYPSYLFAEMLSPVTSPARRSLWVATLSGLIMTSWDLVMDPQMVHGGALGLGGRGALFWHPSAKLLGLVADDLCLHLALPLAQQGRESLGDRACEGSHSLAGIFPDRWSQHFQLVLHRSGRLGNGGHLRDPSLAAAHCAAPVLSCGIRMRLLLILVLGSLILSGCARPSQEVTMNLTFSSPAFGYGQSIPAVYSCKGKDISPPLQWSDLPQGTKALALIMEDPDAPMGTWVHWVIYNISPTRSGLEEAIPPQERLPDGTLQGKNSWRRIGYGGPCPPSGTHRYFFRLYALDRSLPLAPGATREELLKAMQGHILGQGEWMGTFAAR